MTGPRLPPTFQATTASKNPDGFNGDRVDTSASAFVKAYRGHRRFRGGARLWTWMYRMLINTCYDIGRHRVTRRVDRTVELADAEPVTSVSGDHPLRVTFERLVARRHRRLYRRLTTVS